MSLSLPPCTFHAEPRSPILVQVWLRICLFFFFLALRECPIQAPQRVLMVLANFPMAVLRWTPLSEWLLTPHLFCSSTSRWCHTSLDLLIYYIAMVWLSVSSVYILPHLQGDKLFWVWCCFHSNDHCDEHKVVAQCRTELSAKQWQEEISAKQNVTSCIPYLIKTRAVKMYALAWAETLSHCP